VSDNSESHRYEAVVDGTVAGFIAYRDRPDGARVFLHTETDPAFAGKGIASSLVRQALEAEREHGRRIVPVCPFVAAYLTRHPEYQNLAVG
jgi:predicted GNAT family acetyltransferase